MTPTILIVDDNPADIELLCEAFADLGAPASFRAARDGEQAIAGLRRGLAAGEAVPDLIIIDLNMPRVGGREVLAFVRSLPALAAVPAAILTSSSSPGDRSDCLRLGASAFFTKPSDLDALRTLAGELSGLLLAGRRAHPTA